MVNNTTTKGPFNSTVLPSVKLLDLNAKMPDFTQFRQAAKYFEEHGYYPHYNPVYQDKIDARQGSDFRKYWDEERRRCRFGHKIGNTTITGNMYFHLNYGRIQKLPELTAAQNKALQEGKSISIEKVQGFPDPWDSTWHILNYIQDAKDAGKHAALIKSRGIGATYILSTLALNIYYHTPGGKVYVLAPHEVYLTGTDAILTRMWEHMDFMETHTPFFKIREGGNTNTKMVRRAKLNARSSGHHGGNAGKEAPSIQGLIVQNANKFRGPRGHLLILDEAGINKNVSKILNISKRAFEQNKAVYGMILPVGTGGSALSDLAGFQDIILNPESYDILGIENTFSKVGSGKKMALFIGAYWNNAGHYDSLGRSNTQQAYDAEIAVREAKAKLVSTKSETYLQYVSENALHPEEALQNIATSHMPTELLNAQLDFLRSNPPDVEIGRMDLSTLTTGTFIPDKTLIPLNEFPTNKGVHYKGAVVIKYRPVPLHEYIIGVDPYAQDTSGTASHGAIYVFDLTADRFVAHFVGRPKINSAFMKTAITMARYYNNAGTLFENDIPEFNSMYKMYDALDLLLPQPSIVSTILPTSKVRRKFGMHKSVKVYNTTFTWFVDWMVASLETDDGKVGLINMDTMYDIGLLLELILFSEDLNFDRLNAVSMVLLQRQEYLTLKSMQAKRKRTTDLDDEYKKHLLNLLK